MFYRLKVPAKGAGKKKNTKDVDMVKKMFEEIAPKYAGRNGGYTRIVKIGQRKGDGAMEVLIEQVWPYTIKEDATPFIPVNLFHSSRNSI